MNLLFDLGGVIVDIRRQNCEEAFRRLGFTDISKYLGDYGQKGIFLAVEDGSATADEFRAALHTRLPEEVTDREIDQAFESFIVGIPRHRLEALRRLKKQGHKLYVISNTNPIMWYGVLRKNFEQEGGDVHTYFNGVVTSFEAGCCKPDPRIFNLCCQRFGIRPDNTIFFDDSEENCRAAEKLGFKAIHVAPGQEFINLIPNIDE